MAYLDHAATTPVSAEAAAAMWPWLTERFGNPSGAHATARAARCAVDEARDVMASTLGVGPAGIVFTSGGTESDNMAVNGVAAGRRAAVVVSAVEHHAVLRSACATVSEVRVVPVDLNGVVDLDALADLLDADVALVSVMLVNNEVGTVQPIDEISRIVRRKAPKALLHSDAIQAMPWIDVASAAATADLISVSAHKFGGPQGVGVLGIRGDLVFRPLLHGGGQERDRRSGTHNVAGIVGMAAAAAATVNARELSAKHIAAERDRLADGLLATVPGSTETGSRRSKAPGHCHLRFAGIESEALLILLDDEGVAASAGSACTSGALEPSHVLLAMGVDPDDALGSLRLTLGHTTTPAEVDHALVVVADAVARLRAG